MSEHAPVKGKEFIDRVAYLGQHRNVPDRVDAKRGKGSHVILYYGPTGRPWSRIGARTPGLLAAMTRQLGLDPGDLG